MMTSIWEPPPLLVLGALFAVVILTFAIGLARSESAVKPPAEPVGASPDDQGERT